MVKPEYNRGFSLFELIVVVVIISILATVLFNRLQFYQEMAEKAAMEQTIGILRSALNLQIASRIAKGQLQEIEELACDNPMSWLAQEPRNYQSEYVKPFPGEMPTGNWYFDSEKRELVYLVDRGKHFIPDSSGQKRIRFRAAVVLNSAIASDSANQEIIGVVLKAVEPYSWGGI